MKIIQQTMNKKTYSAPKTELVSVACISHLLEFSQKESIDADAKENDFLKPAGDNGNNRGNYNPWSTWEDNDD